MRAYKLEVLVIDHDNVGLSVKEMLEDANFPNDCISPKVMKIQIADIGEWSDDHPLNKKDTFLPYYEGLLKDDKGLLPCPKCGEKAGEFDGKESNELSSVGCWSCGSVCCDGFDTIEEAREEWNKRG